jgi:uncharacterized protein YcbK (DUF882 family)
MRQISLHFNEIEFQSKDGDQMPEILYSNLVSLCNNLEKIRTAIQYPIHVISGYRSIEHNKKVGGVPNSFHCKAMAADITCKNITPMILGFKIIDLINTGKIIQGGVGIYQGFVHYDIRGYKARW